MLAPGLVGACRQQDVYMYLAWVVLPSGQREWHAFASSIVLVACMLWCRCPNGHDRRSTAHRGDGKADVAGRDMKQQNCFGSSKFGALGEKRSPKQTHEKKVNGRGPAEQKVLAVDS